MKDVFKIGKIPLLNFYDLQRRFSLSEILAHHEEFTAFARVHTVPLQLLVYPKDEDVYAADFFNKRFWLSIFEKNITGVLRGKFENVLSAEECSAVLTDIAGGADNENKSYAAKESNDILLTKKLDVIKRVTDSLNFHADFADIVMYLAVYELCEINTAERQEQAIANDIAFLMHDKGNESSAHDEFAAYELFSSGETELAAGDNPYRYWFYEDDTLGEGMNIEVVKLFVNGSSGDAVIELYSPSTKMLVKSFTLRCGEYIYCTIADHKIIRVIPSYSKGTDIILSRTNLSESVITVKTKENENYEINADDVSYMAADSEKTGFMLIRNGKVSASYYQPYQHIDWVHSNISILAAYSRAAEISFKDGQYLILFSNGSVNGDAAVRKVSFLSKEERAAESVREYSEDNL